ncbi:MAG: S8 family serine peptidase [Planctomycetes bacterium]|nr:S8 family serine peptidase [Planctomycetota bacterium]
MNRQIWDRPANGRSTWLFFAFALILISFGVIAEKFSSSDSERVENDGKFIALDNIVQTAGEKRYDVDRAFGATFADGQIVVWFRSDAPADALEVLTAAENCEAVATIPELRVALLDYSRKIDVIATSERLLRHPYLLGAEPNFAYSIPGASESESVQRTSKSGASKPEESWVAFALGLAPAHKISRGSMDVKIAVIDTGVTKQRGFARELLPGYDFVREENDASDENGHGTRIASLILSDDGDEVVGVAPECGVIPVRVFGKTGVGTNFDLLRGLLFARDSGANVVNLSFASRDKSNILESVCDSLLAENVTLVGAIGNDGLTKVPTYPACFESVIAIGAIDENFETYKLGNIHPKIIASAPGVDVPVTGLYGEVARDTGTSVAAGIASAVVALVRSKNPGMSTNAAIAQMLKGIFDTGEPGRDYATGFGAISASGALSTAAFSFHDVAIRSARIEDSFLSLGQGSVYAIDVENAGTFAETNIRVTARNVFGRIVLDKTIETLRAGEVERVEVPMEILDCLPVFTGRDHTTNWGNALSVSVTKLPDELRYDNNERGITFLREFDELETSGTVYRICHANSLNKDMWSDAPWRVEDDQTAIPFSVTLKDCGDDELDQLRSIRIKDITGGASNVIFDLSFNAERIGDNAQEKEYWIFETKEAFGAASLASGTPLTAANLGYSVGTDIDFEIRVTSRDNLASTLGYDEHYTKHVRVHIGDEKLPLWNDWYYVDTHFHTMYTNNIAEWGGSPFTASAAARAIGMHFLCMTDHSCDLDELSDGQISYRTDIYEYTEWTGGQAVTTIQDNRTIGAGTTWDALGYEETMHSDAAFQVVRNTELNAGSLDPSLKDKTIHMLVFGSPYINSPKSGMQVAGVSFDGPASPNLSNALSLIPAPGFSYAAHPKDMLSSMVNGGTWTSSDVAAGIAAEVFRGFQGFNERVTFKSSNQDNPWADFDSGNTPGTYPNALYNEVRHWDENVSAQMSNLVGGVPRKLRFIAGSDAHGDYNFGADLTSSGSEDADDNALSKARTLVYIPDPQSQWDESNLPPKIEMYRALREGVAVATDGPLVRMEIDNGRGQIAQMAGNTVVVRGDGATIAIDYLNSLEWGSVTNVDLYRGDVATGNSPLLLSSWMGGQVTSNAGSFSGVNMDTFQTSTALSLLPSIDGWVYYRAHIQTQNSRGLAHNGYSNPIWVYVGTPGITPTVTSVNPQSVLNDQARTITLTGTALDLTQAVTVKNGAHLYTCTNLQIASATSISVDIPAGMYPGTGYQFSVATPTGTSMTSPALTVVEPLPTVTSVSPSLASDSSNTFVTITGTSFIGTTGARLSDGASTALSNVVIVSDTEVQAIVPAGVIPGTYNVLVTNSTGSSAAVTQTIQIVSAPVTTSVSPSSGRNTSAISVTISGSGFSGATGASLGGMNGVALTNFVVVSDSQISANVPSGLAAGSYKLFVASGAIESTGSISFVTNDGVIADAGPDQDVQTGTVTLNGSTSRDPAGGTITSYLWTQVSGPSTSLVGASIAMPTFEATSAGTYVFSLVVTAGSDTSAPDQVIVTVTASGATPPIPAAVPVAAISGSGSGGCGMTSARSGNSNPLETLGMLLPLFAVLGFVFANRR